MDRIDFQKGDILMKQGDPQDRCVEARGSVLLSESNPEYKFG